MIKTVRRWRSGNDGREANEAGKHNKCQRGEPNGFQNVITNLFKKMFLWHLLLASAFAHGQINIAVITQPASGDADSAHWQFMLPEVLKSKLREVRSLRVLPKDSVDYALSELRLDPMQRVGVADLQRVGRMIEAEYVIAEFSQKEGQQFKIAVQVVNCGDGGKSRKLTSRSVDCRNASTDIAIQILREFGIKPSAEEQKRMERNFTSSLEALELFSRAEYAISKGERIGVVDATLRQALSLDPKSATILQALAYGMSLRGEFREAEEMAKEAIRYRPDYAPAYYALGTIYMGQGLMLLAREQLSEATKLDPDNPDYYVKLSETYSQKNEWDQAVTILKQAERLAPYDATVHAELAMTYIYTGKRELARIELMAAERYNLKKDFGVYLLLAFVCDRLNEGPQAVANYELFLSGAKAVGVESPEIQRAERRLAELKATLVPRFLTAAPPRDFSPEELEQALKEKLVPEEYGSVTNPLVSTAEMRKWAKQLAEGADDDLEKATRLYKGIAHRTTGREKPGFRTASESFDLLQQPGAELTTCQEYAFLYVALARAVGLKAYFVAVDRDAFGRLISHGCAAVFVNGKALLIDPAWEWFGIPHQNYEILNDLQTIGIYLAQMPDPRKSTVGVKLVPGMAKAHFWAAVVLGLSGRLQQAHAELAAGFEIDSTNWLGVYARGIIAMKETNWKDAAEYLKRSLELNPDDYATYFFLGAALQNLGKLDEARESYRAYLSTEENPEYADAARIGIMVINQAFSGYDLRLQRETDAIRSDK
jgi:tetratricopeptide (TPR) repeat protein